MRSRHEAIEFIIRQADEIKVKFNKLIARDESHQINEPVLSF